MLDLKSRIYGTLVGVAAGDAMGMPSSMMSPKTIRDTFDTYINEFLPAPKGHVIHNNMVAGEVTDDTQQTLLLADTIIEKKEIDPEDVSRRLIKWAEDINAFDSMVLGPSTLRSLFAIKSGKSIYETGSAGDTNGAAMKISPAGIFGKGDLDKTIDAVSKTCLPTHNTNIAIAGASAIAMAVGAGIAGETSIDKVIELALKAAEVGMTKGNIWYGASIIDRTKLALDIVTSNVDKRTKMDELYNVIGAGVMMTETVPLCLAVSKMANGDPVDAIQICTNLGGDCDTTSSIVGGICGAFSGIEAFPAEWIDKLESVNHMNLDKYADQLYEIIK